MNQEAASCLPEIYSGDDIDHIEITGAHAIFQEVRLMLKDGSAIFMRVEMLVCPQRILPQIKASRVKWGRIANKPIQPTVEENDEEPCPCLSSAQSGLTGRCDLCDE